MAGTAGEESGVGRSVEGISSGQRCQSGELAEWRSSEQVENGTPSTSPPYWDTDDDDDGGMVFTSCIFALLGFFLWGSVCVCSFIPPSFYLGRNHGISDLQQLLGQYHGVKWGVIIVFNGMLI